MNPILNVDDLLRTILKGRLTEEYTPNELVQTLAGVPTFSMGAHPRSTEDVQNSLTIAEEICEDVVKPALEDESEFDVVVSEISSALRAELMQHVDAKEGVSKWAEWADETEYLLKDYPASFRREAAVLLSLKAQLGETVDFSQEAVSGLVTNLSLSDTNVRTSCAKALAEIASEDPVKVNSELHLLFEPLVYGQTEMRQELLTAVVRVVENLPPSEDLNVDHTLLAELARYCLVNANDRLTEILAARLLAQLAELDPKACTSAAPALYYKQNDPHPDIADAVDAALSELRESDVSVDWEDTESNFAPEFYDMCLCPPSTEKSIQCPSITDDCSDWALMADGNSLDGVKTDSSEAENMLTWCVSD